MTASSRPDFALNPMAALVVAHNTVVANTPINARPVSKFSDKATAVKRLNAVIDLAEEAGYTLSYLPNGAIERISDPAPAVDPHAASNQLISDAVASNPELAAIATVTPFVLPDVLPTYPEGLADLATAAENAGEYAVAADLWISARGASIGHNRRDRYEEAAERCRALVAPVAASSAPSTSVGGLTTLELSHRIEVLVENPKRKGSRARSDFDLYRTGMTGEEFVLAVIAAGMDRRVALSNLHWDIDHGFIYLGADVEAK